MNDARLEKLKEALLQLAASPSDQLSFLQDQGVPECVDELALDYDAIAASAGDMMLSGILTAPQHDSVRSLLAYLKSISGSTHADLWTASGLHTSPEWKEVRRLAAECLTLLKSPEDSRCWGTNREQNG